MQAVLHPTMDWRGILVLSFLFASGFIHCQYNEKYGAYSGSGQRGQPFTRPAPTADTVAGNQAISEQTFPQDTSLDNGKTTENSDDGDETGYRKQYDVGRYACVESNANYDCVFRNVFINDSYHHGYFGSSNEAFNHQTKLKFRDSAIRTLPKALLDTFRNVELLNLEQLQIEKIASGALKNGRKIKQLFLGYNNIMSLDPGAFDSLVALENLVMSGNNLSSIPYGLFNNAKSLTALSLANNNLNSIEDTTFVHNAKLENINMTNNQLVYFNLSRIQTLFDADVSHNKLEKLEIPLLVELIDASHNEIKEVIGQKNNRLNQLLLSHNNLSTTEWLKRFENVEILDLSHNKIEDITSKDFKQLQKLTTLKLNNNRLFTFEIQNGDVMKNLKILDLSHNELFYVENNYRQFQTLDTLYLHHNFLVSLKLEKTKKGSLIKWSNMATLTLSNNDWDCSKMEAFLAEFPRTLSHDFGRETQCGNALTNQGLCCTKVDMPYHDRLIKKIAQVSSYEKVARINRQCNAASLTSSAQNVSTIVTQPGALPSSELEKEVQALKIAVQTIEGNVARAESQVTNNIQKIDTLTRIYRVTKTGLVLPSATLSKVVDHLKQRDEFKVNETKARYDEAEGKKQEKELIASQLDTLTTMFENKNNQKAAMIKEAVSLKTLVNKLQRDVNRNTNAIKNGK